MILTTTNLAAFLGRPASALLTAPPFSGWTFRKSLKNDLDPPEIHYVCDQEGIDLIGDADDRVTTIFLHTVGPRRFTPALQDLPATLRRHEVIDRFGPPSKSGDRHRSPLLGEMGAWDRFERGGYTLHTQFCYEFDAIRLITLMRPDVVP